MDLVLFEENKPFVLQALEDGDFDYIDSASEVFETDFFRYINARAILKELAESYPTPRKKEEVPLWLFIASNLSLRLHGEQAFHAFPMVVRVGGMLNAFGPKLGKKVTHPDTGDTTVSSQGFNKKNHYDRQTPCDHDFLRKLARDTEANAQMQWFGQDIVKVLRKRRAFDKEGIFIGDGSYLFVPDNPKYEGSVKLLFDESNHPLSKKDFAKLSDEQKARCQWRRCYKMVTLLHTNRTLDFFLFVGVKILPGNAHESPVLYELVDQFVDTVGKGVIKRLILDRGFLDGAAITRCKKDQQIDVLIPVRRNMDIYADADALFEQPDVHWVEWTAPQPEPKIPPRPRPEAVVKRERSRRKTIKKHKAHEPPPPPDKTLVSTQVAAIGGFRSWSSCQVPLTVVCSREHYGDGHTEKWYLLDTRRVQNPKTSRDDYRLRTAIEERYRQYKCFNNLTGFTSRAFSLVVNQVVFVMLAVNLLQFYLLRQGRKKLNNKPLPGIRRELVPTASYVIVYWQNYYGLFSALELAHILLTLDDDARHKGADRCRRLKGELSGLLRNPRPT